MISIKAIYERGVFRPLTPVRLKDATEVVVLLPIDAARDDDDSTGWKAAERFIGFIKTAPPGEPIAEEHDKHLYK
jgi:predicted DNA-binding antitoxin AbrB/MazE fold protein